MTEEISEMENMMEEEMPEFMTKNGIPYRLHPQQQVYYIWEEGEPWPPEEQKAPMEHLPQEIAEHLPPEVKKKYYFLEDGQRQTPKRWGTEWTNWMKIEYPEEYEQHVREETLRRTACMVDEMTYELMDDIETRELAKITLSKDILKQTRQRNQIRDVAIEIARAEIIHQLH